MCFNWEICFGIFLQGNLLFGQIVFDDFIERDKYLFDLIFNMLCELSVKN
jgi:hypothetical protein